MQDSPELIARDMAAVKAISAVPAMLRIVCQSTGMGFAAVARVTEGSWTACAVQDDIGFGLTAGGQLPIETTLCMEARAAREPVVFDHASLDPIYKDHHTPRIYNIESYISVPIILEDGEYFGNLCAIDPQPRSVAKPETVAMFLSFANLIGLQLTSERLNEVVATELVDERARSQLRENFIAVLGHDLRNPLATVSMSAEILLRTSTDPKIVTLGERLRATSRRMSKLVDDVLDLTRGRLGNGIGVTRDRVDNLAPSLNDVIDEMRLAFPGRHIHASVDIDRPVDCDKVRVQQLLSNLIGNALTYGDEDQAVTISADLRGNLLEIAVLNEGEAISEETQARLFEPFWRPENSKPGAGLGLGLYICAEIAKAHDGAIKVNSSNDGGTMFMAQLKV